MGTGTDGSSRRVVIDDSNRELSVVLSYLLGRQLRTAEIVSALELSRSAYYLQRDEGRLITADNLLRLAAALDINPVDLLVRYGLVSPDAVTEYSATQNGAPAPPTKQAKKSRLQPRLDLPPI
jgi:DNA-binding Xre family transcriptional regulator